MAKKKVSGSTPGKGMHFDWTLGSITGTNPGSSTFSSDDSDPSNISELIVHKNSLTVATNLWIQQSKFVSLRDSETGKDKLFEVTNIVNSASFTTLTVIPEGSGNLDVLVLNRTYSIAQVGKEGTGGGGGDPTIFGGFYFDWTCGPEASSPSNQQITFDDLLVSGTTEIQIHKESLVVDTEDFIGGQAYINITDKTNGQTVLFRITSSVENVTNTFWILDVVKEGGNTLTNFVETTDYRVGFGSLVIPESEGGWHFDWNVGPVNTSPGNGYFSFNQFNPGSATILRVHKESQTVDTELMLGDMKYINVTNIITGETVLYEITAAEENVTFTFWNLTVVAYPGNTLTAFVQDDLYRIGFTSKPFEDAPSDGGFYGRLNGAWIDGDSRYALLNHEHLARGMAWQWLNAAEGGTPSNGRFNVDDNASTAGITEILISKEWYHAAATSYDTGTFMQDLGLGYIKILALSNNQSYLFKINSSLLISSSYYFFEVTPIDGRMAAIIEGVSYEISFMSASEPTVSGAAISSRSIVGNNSTTRWTLPGVGPAATIEHPVVTIYDTTNSGSRYQIKLGRYPTGLPLTTDVWIEPNFGAGNFDVVFALAPASGKIYYVVYSS